MYVVNGSLFRIKEEWYNEYNNNVFENIVNIL